ncbi:MAG: hypothetical protein AABW81_02805 [Nanoarchaeota archaeon]
MVEKRLEGCLCVPKCADGGNLGTDCNCWECSNYIYSCFKLSCSHLDVGIVTATLYNMRKVEDLSKQRGVYNKVN